MGFISFNESYSAGNMKVSAEKDAHDKSISESGNLLFSSKTDRYGL